VKTIYGHGKYIFWLIFVVLVLSCDRKPNQKLYFLGQNPPGLEPKRFAEDILFNEITDDKHEELHSSVYFTPDSKKMYYTIHTRSIDTGKYNSKIMMIEFKNGNWSKPKVVPFSGKYDDSFLAFSFDGKRLYFKSDRPVEVEVEQKFGNTWYIEKANNKWSKPKYLGSLINTCAKVGCPSFTSKNDIYFYKSFVKDEGWGEILKSRYIQNKYSEPEKLGTSINTDHYECFPNVSPDENYLIFYRLIPEGGTGQYISFKDEKGQWSEAVNMGKSINAGGIAFCTSFSPDRKYIFYLLRQNEQIKTEGIKRDEGIYWIDSKILQHIDN